MTRAEHNEGKKNLICKYINLCKISPSLYVNIKFIYVTTAVQAENIQLISHLHKNVDNLEPPFPPAMGQRDSHEFFVFIKDQKFIYGGLDRQMRTLPQQFSPHIPLTIP